MSTTHVRTARLLRSSNTIEPVLERRSAVSPPTGGDHDQKAREELRQCAGLGGYRQGDRGGGADPLRGVQGGHSRARVPYRARLDAPFTPYGTRRLGGGLQAHAV